MTEFVFLSNENPRRIPTAAGLNRPFESLHEPALKEIISLDSQPEEKVRLIVPTLHCPQCLGHVMKAPANGSIEKSTEQVKGNRNAYSMDLGAFVLKAGVRRMQKSRAIILLIACTVTSGCSLHLFKWSMQEVAWFSCLLLVMTGCVLVSANRITLQRAGAPSAGVGPVFCLAGLFFLVWGSKLNLINAFGSDVPFWDQWGIEGILYPAASEGALDPSFLFHPHNVHRPLFLRLFNTMLLGLNGQWDPIVAMVVSSLVYSLILTGLCLVLWRLAGRKNLPLFCVMVSIIGVLHFSWENTLGGIHSCWYFLLGFSLLSIILLLCSKPFTIPWLLGLAARCWGSSIGNRLSCPICSRLRADP